MATSHGNIDVIGRSKPRRAKKAIYKRPNCHCNKIISEAFCNLQLIRIRTHTTYTYLYYLEQEYEQKQ